MRSSTAGIRLLLVIYITFTSCNKDDDCVDALTMDFSNAADEFQAVLIEDVFENDNFIVSAPIFFSPNGDGINDFLSIWVERKDSEVAFVSANGPIANPELTSNPDGYLLEGSIKVSNNCTDIFVSQDLEELFWGPNPNTGDLPSNGNYNLTLRLTLADGEIVESVNSIDISRWGTN